MRYLAVAVLLLGHLCSLAQNQPQPKRPRVTNRILFLFDASQSMYGRWQSGVKIDMAKQILTGLIDSLETVPDLQLALRAYGHQSPFISGTQRDCKDTKLEVPFGKGAKAIREKLKELQPKGTTPIAYSLEQAAGDFPPCSDCRNMIILITDGIEECDGDPCAISAALQAKGIVLRPFVIGIGLDESLLKRFNCVGNVFDASTEADFRKVLNVVITQALNPTTVQVNLMDAYGRPNETDVNMTFYERNSGRMRYNLVHTINNYGMPDTLNIDALTSYRIKVHSIPPVVKDSVILTPGIHNIVGIDCPQGDLELRVMGRHDYRDLSFIVRRKGEMQTLNVQSVDVKERYLVGEYDLEVLTLPRMLIDNVRVSQSHTTKVEVPQPGIANINRRSKGVGDIFVKKGPDLEWVYSFKSDSGSETIVLQPGEYKVVFRPLASKRTFYTIEKDFVISSGKSELIEIQ
jgi:Ca-activated chloride channel family protein